MKLSKIDSTSSPNAFAVSSGALRVTDPCYDMETWCAGTLDNVKNGIWQAHVGYRKPPEEQQWMLDSLKESEERIAKARAAVEGLDTETAKTRRIIADMDEQDLAKRRADYEAHIGRVAYLHICHENTQSHFDHEAEFDSTWAESDIHVGVDSGQAGFFDYALFDQMCGSEAVKDKFYDEVCALTCDTQGQWGVHPVGCVSSTGWGDGSYDCLVRRDEEGRAIEAIIIYMAEYEEEDDDSGD